jgi:hypothetical protein
MTKTTTPWGKASLVEKISLSQRAGDKHFSSQVELLEDDKGVRFIRIAYLTSGAIRRGPVTLRPRDVERLHHALAKAPELAAALGLNRGGA